VERARRALNTSYYSAGNPLKHAEYFYRGSTCPQTIRHALSLSDSRRFVKREIAAYAVHPLKTDAVIAFGPVSAYQADRSSVRALLDPQR